MRALRVFCYGNSCLLMLALCGCGILSSGPINPKSTEYRIHFTNNDWKEIDPNVSDKAFQNIKNGNVITLSSICRATEAPLDIAVQSIFNELKELKILKTSKVKYQGVDAIETDVEGKLEEKNSFIRTMTFYKKQCTFDVLMISQHQFRESDISAYRQFLKSITFD